MHSRLRGVGKASVIYSSDFPIRPSRGASFSRFDQRFSRLFVRVRPFQRKTFYGKCATGLRERSPISIRTRVSRIAHTLAVKNHFPPFSSHTHILSIRFRENAIPSFARAPSAGLIYYTVLFYFTCKCVYAMEMCFSVTGSSDRESGATSIGGNLSDSTTDGTPTITLGGDGLDMDSISVVSSIQQSHLYHSEYSIFIMKFSKCWMCVFYVFV